MYYSRKLSFIDNDNKRFRIRIKTDLGYFSICSQSGQGQFNAKNQAQQDLLDIWDGFHLKSISSLKPDFLIKVDEICDKILDLEKADQKTFIKDDDLTTYDAAGEEVVFLDENRKEIDVYEYFQDIYMDDEVDKAIAIAIMFNIPLEFVEDLIIHEYYNRWIIEGEEYLFGTNDEMDEEWDEDLQNYLDELVLPDLPETMRKYFDEEAWKSDARDDGRAHSLNRYDGGEKHVKYDGENYYAYQQG